MHAATYCRWRLLRPPPPHSKRSTNLRTYVISSKKPQRIRQSFLHTQLHLPEKNWPCLATWCQIPSSNPCRPHWPNQQQCVTLPSLLLDTARERPCRRRVAPHAPVHERAASSTSKPLRQLARSLLCTAVHPYLSACCTHVRTYVRSYPSYLPGRAFLSIVS